MVTTLLVGSIIDSSNEGLPERIAEELGCSDGADGVHASTAAAAHRALGSNGYSWFAAIHAERVLGINGCDSVGPATRFLELGNQVNMSHVLATLRTFGAICVVDRSIFEGRLLDGRAQLVELCDTIGGKLKVAKPKAEHPYTPANR